MKHRGLPPCPDCDAKLYTWLPLSRFVHVGEQVDAPGYPPLQLWNYTCHCGRVQTVTQAAKGRCDVCNELSHPGPC